MAAIPPPRALHTRSPAFDARRKRAQAPHSTSAFICARKQQRCAHRLQLCIGVIHLAATRTGPDATSYKDECASSLP
jgi:hypothetical protein